MKTFKNFLLLFFLEVLKIEKSIVLVSVPNLHFSVVFSACVQTFMEKCV